MDSLSMAWAILPDRGWWPKGMFAPLLPALDALLAAVLVELFLYGIHLVAFSLCFYILLVRRRRTQLVVLVATVLMFALSTADIALSFRVIVRDIHGFLNLDIGLGDIATHLSPKNLIFITNNFIGDLLLLYRCYVIWDRKKVVMLLSTPLLIGDTIWGFVSAGPNLLALQLKYEPFYLWSVFSINVIMTIATAGRILWVVRFVKPVLRRRDLRRYHVVVAILIESAAVYTIVVLLRLVTPEKPVRWIFDMIMLRIVCIMPTLMIVQVELQAAWDRYASKQDDAEAAARDTRSMQFQRPTSTLATSTSVVLDTLATLNSANRSISIIREEYEQGESPLSAGQDHGHDQPSLPPVTTDAPQRRE